MLISNLLELDFWAQGTALLCSSRTPSISSSYGQHRWEANIWVHIKNVKNMLTNHNVSYGSPETDCCHQTPLLDFNLCKTLSVLLCGLISAVQSEILNGTNHPRK